MRDVRFVFLGTGTSAGIPMIGCHCAVCTSQDPRDQRLRTAAALQFTDDRGQERVILLDAGPDLRAQALRQALSRCDAIFFTHNHVDHIFGLDEVRRFNAVMKAPIDVYADDHTMDSLERVYKHIFERDQNVNDSFVATLIPHRVSAHAIAACTPIRVHGLTLTPIPLLHGKLPVLGWRIEHDDGRDSDVLPLAYCTDVSGIPPETWTRLRGLSTLVLDCLRERSHPTHLTLNQAVGIADSVGARRTFFVHMAHELAHAATQERLPEAQTLAWDGLVLRESARA